jgi:hypothetical protein
MSAAAHEQFVFEVLDTGAAVYREDDQLVATRELSDDEISMGEVISLAHSHGLLIDDVVTDVPDGEMRLHLEVDHDGE